MFGCVTFAAFKECGLPRAKTAAAGGTYSTFCMSPYFALQQGQCAQRHAQWTCTFVFEISQFFCLYDYNNVVNIQF
jgi:hypothetical protein